MGLIAVIWGMGGILTLFGFAIVRLSQVGLDAWSVPFQWHHWLITVIWVIFMAYNEGYKGFQKGFSPRVAARIAYLYRNPTPLHLLLAPLFCMGYFHISRKRQIITFALTLTIIGLVQAVSLLDQPWRGIVDLGVVIGLTWGIISLVLFTYQAFTQADYPHSPDIPAELSARA
ncbi:hypothetical protein [Motiliproteus sp.]|uniref:hypothetical protein n=1 Tax=Motiliproteus sp. TaxID=1898955 RepID=UPI003BAA75B5